MSDRSNEVIDSRAAYVRSGRAYRSLSDNDLAEKLADALRATLKDPRKAASWHDQSDLVAEYALRDQSLPRDALEQLAAIVLQTPVQLKSRGVEIGEKSLKSYCDLYLAVLQRA